jgi:hypothetical protein
MRTHVVLENGNCVLCNARLLSALRQRKRVQRVYTDFSTGCLVIEHDDDPAALLSLLTTDGRAVALAANGERVMVRVEAHETGRCPVAKSAATQARWDTEPVRVSDLTSGSLDVVDECGYESFPASDPPQWWRLGVPGSGERQSSTVPVPAAAASPQAAVEERRGVRVVLRRRPPPVLVPRKMWV